MEKTKTLFEEQLRERTKNDTRQMRNALIDVADALRGEARFHMHEHMTENVRRELERICAYYRVEIPEDLPLNDDLNDTIDMVTRPTGIMHRRISLDGTWWKDGDGALLAVRKEDGRILALIPAQTRGYCFTDDSGREIHISAQNAADFEREAVCFYRPLPQREMNGRDLVRFLFRSVSRGDLLQVLLASLCISLIGLILPFATGIIFSRIIPTGSVLLVSSIMVLLLSAAVSTYLISAVRSGLLDRIRQRMEVMLENATMGRVLNLPPKFFQGKSAGGLSQSVMSLRFLPTVLTDAILGPLMTVGLSIIYIVQIALMAPSLALPALVIFLLQGFIIYVSIRQKMRMIQEELAGDIETQGVVYPLITGIQRIRLSGSEKRAVTQWAAAYKKKAGAAFRVRFPSIIQNELVAAAALLGTLWVYAVGAKSGISVSQFAIFLASFGVVTANFNLLSQSALLLSYLHPILDMIEPVLQNVPEVSAGKHIISSLRGGVELNHVSFRYRQDQPLILDDISLKIQPGEYVAIVGRSGCGKSTMLRLLMGFEKPEVGTVSFDSMDLEEIDPGSLRRNIGTVLQNGKLFAGDIFSNITISAPQLTMQEAWEAAEMAGIADTIRSMPMGMHTLISEGSGGISGGQKQRLLIARAIAPKPQILMFDEATSALDNITQKIVSDSLDSLHCTRIVVAHRLSTIKNCDRIIMLERGKIIEDGSYDELMAKNGAFADLVARQKV